MIKVLTAAKLPAVMKNNSETRPSEKSDKIKHKEFIPNVTQLIER